MFYDLNVKGPGLLSVNKIFDETIDEIVKLGYRGIAITTDIDETDFGSAKKSKKKDKGAKRPDQPEDVIPPPPDLSNLITKYPKVKFYKRINIALAEYDNIRKVQHSKNLKKYNLVSIQPMTQNVLRGLATINEVDIISFQPENRFSLSLNRKTYNQLVNMNVYFEIIYSPALVDSSARKNLFVLSHSYHALGRSKNVFVSSGAKTSSVIRSPYDVINFNLLFGLNEEQAKSAISRTCEKIILRAGKKRLGKTVMDVVKEGKLKKVKKSKKKISEPMEVEES